MTNGELPRIPATSLRLSTLRIRIATARAAVANVILMNRNSYRVVSDDPRIPLKGGLYQRDIGVI
jgi:hypothetical protein